MKAICMIAGAFFVFIALVPWAASAKKLSDLPMSYDPRNTSLSTCISVPLDQGACGSCYAFAASSTFSDRLCIALGVKSSPAGNNSYISPQDALSCSRDSGCHGGRAIDVWTTHFATNGGRTCTKLCTAGCIPYTSGSGCHLDVHRDGCAACRKTCADSGAPSPVTYFSNSSQAGFVTTHSGLSMVDAMKLEIYQNGPVAAVMEVYANFQSYYRSHPHGVYTSTQKSKSEGSHAIRIIGWGESMEKDMDNGTVRLVPWWLISNSWGQDWGAGGYFRMERGKNLVGIEDKGTVFAGCPKNAGQKCQLTFPLRSAMMTESASPRIAGEWKLIDSVADEISGAARKHLTHKFDEHASSYIWALKSIESQAVAGMNYRLTFVGADAASDNQADSTEQRVNSFQILVHRNLDGEVAIVQ